MSHIIGIDVSKATLDYAYLRDPDQDKTKRKSCQNEVDRFESLITWTDNTPCNLYCSLSAQGCLECTPSTGWE